MIAPATVPPVTFDQIVAARARLAGGVVLTPCAPSIALSDATGCDILVKREYLQATGSFKERGARNTLLQLDPAQRARGVIAASAGNHALALAYHGRQLGVPVVVVMPRYAPMIKQARCRSMGAEVLLEGETLADARVRADTLAADRGLTYINGFDDPRVIAGAGTIGLEILDQAKDLDAIIAPIGGGGLIAGVALAVKTAAPRIRLIGVQADRCPSFSAALDAGHPVRVPSTPTLADGLAVPKVGDNAFEIARSRVDEVVSVGEEELALAILRVAEGEKGVVEGAGAAPLAALISGRVHTLHAKRVCLLMCGGNIDPTVLGRVIERGLVADGRVTQFTAVIPDRPGGLARFTAALAEAGASVKEIDHERAFSSADISTVQVLCTVETRDAAHVEELHELLRARGVIVTARTQPVSCPVPPHSSTPQP
jgi:threonine dehydratase